ncbi:type VI secretion system protein VasD [Microbulbifer donghaiensis]|uniref:Type VI secretion system protein VasD n=1 Tax=Microbulbifer donghaiensis TaxID=494016 RepID=A0A1M5EGE3_9GAMM|nr:type VI secretion system lipoprotein TssJ [Microbulbifer donghaiensis]SHF78141.1 type VI secretion system protein VasD [Microbulbifer donghaiensis]
MTTNKVFQLLLIGALILTVSACQTTRRTLNFETSVELSVDSENDVNPDNDGRASPVVVRVFMLADDRQFSREDFLNLYENAESRLGNDLLDTVVLKEFAPGEQRIEKLQLSPEVRYIGLLAEFVQYQRADALMLLPITEHKENEYEVTLTGTQIGSTKALAMRRSSGSGGATGSRDDGTVTISSAEYERMRKQLEQTEQGK